MSLEELLEILDLEEAEDFQFFENFADLMEYDGEIRYEDLYALIKRGTGQKGCGSQSTLPSYTGEVNTYSVHYASFFLAFILGVICRQTMQPAHISGSISTLPSCLPNAGQPKVS